MSLGNWEGGVAEKPSQKTCRGSYAESCGPQLECTRSMIEGIAFSLYVLQGLLRNGLGRPVSDNLHTMEKAFFILQI